MKQSGERHMSTNINAAETSRETKEALCDTGTLVATPGQQQNNIEESLLGTEEQAAAITAHDSLGCKKRGRSVHDFANETDLRKALLSVESDDEFCELYLEWLDRIDSGEPVQKVVRQEDLGNDTTHESSFFDHMDWILPSQYDAVLTKPQTVDGEVDRLENLRTFDIVDCTQKHNQTDTAPVEPIGGENKTSEEDESVVKQQPSRDEAMDKLTSLAGRIFAAPIALMSIMDLGREVTIGQHGLGETTMPDTPRKITFCTHTIAQEDRFMVVTDTHNDPRFRGNPFVQGPPHVRFYAGASLVSPEGQRLGALCIYDNTPRPDGLSSGEIDSLCDLADTAVNMLVDRRR